MVYSIVINVGPQAPIAKAGADQTVKVGSTVTLDASSSTDADGNIVSYAWDNGFGTGAVVSKIMDSVGTYAITLTVTDNDNLTNTDTVVIDVVANQAPIANAGNDITIVVGGTAQFDARQSVDQDGHIVSYQWDNGLSGEQVSLQYNDIAEHVVTLTVTDNDGATATDTVMINVVADELKGNFPSMHIAGDMNGWSISAAKMALVANNVWQISLDMNNDARFKFVPVDWSLSFGDRDANGIADSLGGGNIIAKAGTGLYIVTFNDETLAYSLELNLEPQSPTANAGADQTVKVGSTVNLNGNLSTDVNGDITTYHWDNGFGEGQSVSNVMTTIGTFDITLTVTDSAGLSDTDIVTITVVDNQAPVAVIQNGSISVNQGATVTFSSAGSTDSDGSIVSYLWNGASAGETFTLTFNEPGNQQISLLVTDNDGATNVAVITVTVNQLPAGVTVTFQCGKGNTVSGQNIYAVGNIAALGNWNTANAFKLSPTSDPTWTGTIQDAPANKNIQWKCIKKASNGSVIQWEGGSNNSITTGSTGTYTTNGSF